MNNINLKEQIQHKEHNTLMRIYFGTIDPTTTDYLHWHDEMEIIIIKKGYGTIRLDGLAYHVQANDILCINCKVLHFLYCQDETPIQFEAYVFNLDIFGESHFDLFNEKYIEPLRSKQRRLLHIKHNNLYNRTLHKLMNQLKETLLGKHEMYEIQVKANLFEMLYFFYGNHFYENCESISKQRFDCKSVLLYMQQHYQEAIRIDELAEQFHFSTYHFMRLFKKETGKTCTQHINEVRIQHACWLLKTTNLDIGVIAVQSGFHDLSYFNRKFKQLLHMTPKQYRIAV